MAKFGPLDLRRNLSTLSSNVPNLSRNSTSSGQPSGPSSRRTSMENERGQTRSARVSGEDTRPETEDEHGNEKENRDTNEAELNPRIVITSPTTDSTPGMSRAPIPVERASTEHPAYRALRAAAIRYIQEHLAHEQHVRVDDHANGQAHMEGSVRRHGQDHHHEGHHESHLEIRLSPKLSAEAQRYMVDPHYYAPSQHHNSSPASKRRCGPDVFQATEYYEDNRDVSQYSLPSAIHSDQVYQPNLSPILEARATRPIHIGEARCRLCRPDGSIINLAKEESYIPGFKWKDVRKWPGFIISLPAFMWHLIRENFSGNPYKLHPFIYIAMGICLVWCIVVKWVLVCVRLKELYLIWGREWDDEMEREARKLTDMTVSIMPYIVQLVLFCFPPVLAGL